MNILSLTSQQLNRAARIKDRISALERQIAAIVPDYDFPVPYVRGPGRPRKRRGMSLVGRRAIARAQKLRWAKYRKTARTAPKKRKLSAAGRARIIAALKRRWAKVKAGRK